MPGPAVGLTLNLEQLAAWCRKTGRELANPDFTEPLKKCRVLISAAAKNNFEGQHDPDGNPWLPLARPRGRARDQKAHAKGGQDQILRDTGQLMASVTGNGVGHIDIITPTSLTVGTSLYYAAVHQGGATFQVPERQREKPWVFMVDGQTVFTRKIKAHTATIPARPFLGFGEQLVADCLKVFYVHMGTMIQ